MRTDLKKPALLALCLGLAACATQPNQNLEQARSAFSTLQANPGAQQYAALEVQRAEELLNKADRAYREDADEERVDHLAYLANRGVEVAQQTIAMRSAENALQEASAKRAEARLQAREQEIDRLKRQLDAKETERGTLVTFGDVLFDLDSTQLRAGAHQELQKLAEFLRQNPDRQIIVEGYTDSQGAESYNRELSQQRAEAVRAALVKMGIAADRIVALGHGEQYPVASNADSSGRAMNRRVEVTISHDDQAVTPRTSMRQ
jgi:outer membrane protein OmpA-like peptidoglycan-associated protein